MSTTTIRIHRDLHELLKGLARAEETSMHELLARAIEGYRRKRFMDAFNAGYAAVRADSKSKAAFDAELRAWESTLADGLGGEQVVRESPAPRRRRRKGSR